ncbi:MAG: hypothetical protein GY805_17485 [Chloroflexi bacterium]|nr:hypothetical protein [Chloroflexota bacterium]
MDYEDLPALGKTAKIIELIRFCHQNGRFPSLLKTLAQERPRTTWPNPYDPHTLDFLLGQAVKSLLPHEPETVPVPAGSLQWGMVEKGRWQITAV